MTRYIDADAVYKILESCEIRKVTIGNPLTDWEYGYTCGIERAESEIECAPTIDAVPVRHGKWIRDEFGARCSGCGLYAYRDKFDKPWESPYCPICGARMDEE